MESDQFETTIKAAFGAAAKQQRQSLGMTQEMLALKAGLHRTYIADIKRAAHTPSRKNILNTAQTLSTTAAELCANNETIHNWPRLDSTKTASVPITPQG